MSSDLNMNETPSMCPQCGASLPEEAPQGLCPRCLLGAAAMPTDADTLTLQFPEDLPSLEDLGAAFPELEVQEVIGRGGMSVVYRARQPRLDRLVALKILPKSLAATPGFAERFTREGRVLARLKHPNIVTVHDFGESGGFYYLLMEYVDGVNLRQAMRAGRFTPEQALEVVPVMCEALQYAHAEGVLHRDIKPENILLDSKGRIRIADFGIAKIVGEHAESSLLTQSGAKLGTAPYMAPEQIEQPASVDHRADIYSLGVVFYEMLTGELPLGRFAAPSEKAAVGTRVDEVVLRALEKERDRRQQSAGEMKTQIEGLEAPSKMSAAAWPMSSDSFEYKSKRSWLGLPLVHVTSGMDPATGRRRVARGWIAFGDVAVGVVAFGGYARGVFACGGVSLGVVAVGGGALGIVSWGGLALALILAFGGLALAPIATGGLAIGWHALGGWAVGWHAYGGYVWAQYGMGGIVHAEHVVSKIGGMSATVQWLHRIGPWTSLGAFLWMPLMLPMILVPVWARRQLGREKNGATPDANRGGTRILWLIPASLMLGLLAWLLMYCWVMAGGKAQGHLVAPVVISLMGLIVMALCLPLGLRLVPMNVYYGMRIPASYASKQRWYDINAYGGGLMAGWSAVIVAAGLIGFFVLPRYQDSYVTGAVSMSLLSVLFPVAQLLWWTRRLPSQGPVPRPRKRDFWWAKVVVALPLALFIKTFVAEVFIVEGNSVAPEVPAKSRLLAWKLNAHFAPGDLITYDAGRGRTFLGRVSRVEAQRLWITRNRTPEEAVDMARVSGKLVLQHRPSS